MSSSERSSSESTTLICLFHHDHQANAVLDALERAGIDHSSINTITGRNSQDSVSAALGTMGVPTRDLRHLQDGVEDGGTLIVVSAAPQEVSTVERIFGEQSATKIDETSPGGWDFAGAPFADGSIGDGGGREERSIPVIEEELQVGKRTVDQGGVRVFHRVVEIPVEQSINLREERVVVERNAVDRPATDAEIGAQGERSIELTETAEEAVVGKSARVVEEVIVGKQSGERMEHIRETVRRTEVEIENLPAGQPDRRMNRF